MHTEEKRLEVPGNLLLAGEYAVMQHARLGITIAVNPPVVVDIEPWHTLECVADTGTTVHAHATWHRDTGKQMGGSPVFGAVVSLLRDESRVRPLIERYAEHDGATLLKSLRQLHDGSGPNARISVDSRSLYDQSGRKLGFGSSAAATVGTVAGILAALECDPVVHRPLVKALATVAHRDSQAGRGSGYDIATSCFGGVGLFTGGQYTAWKPVDAYWLPQLGVANGPEAQSSKSAIDRFHAALERDPETLHELLDRSDHAARTIAAACTWETGRRGFELARDVGLEIGREIGVPADVHVAPVTAETDRGCNDRFMKALGAGRETIGFIPYIPGCRDHAVLRDEEGLRWA